MPSQKRKFGDVGEKIAQKYLKGKGYEIVEVNYWKPWGEIDIVAKQDGMLVFCEIKTRDSKNTEHFLAESAINRSKIRKLQKICETYLFDKKFPVEQKWQVDVLSIVIDQDNKKAKIKHFKNAIWEIVY